MLQIDYKSGIPIYDQLVNGIIRLKRLGALKAGDALPSVRAMAVKLSVNPNTVQRAYQILEEKGIIYSAAGKGSFIAEDNESDAAIKEILLADFEKQIKSACLKGLTFEEMITLIEKLKGEQK